MIFFKTPEQIEIIRSNGLILGKAHAEVAKLIAPGVSTLALDKVAEEYIRDHQAVPSFKNYNGFPASLCISVNEQVVHGIPGAYTLQEGDIISIDGGVYKNGFHSDSAYSYGVGEIAESHQHLLDVTKASLYKGIEKVAKGARMGDISYAIQSHVEAAGLSIVRELVGHGVGKNLHESPEVPNYGKRGNGIMLREGVVLAIEPMVNLGLRKVVQEKDGWTIRTFDRLPSAHFEHTVAVLEGKASILTTFEFIEAVLQNKYGKASVH